MGLGVGWPGTEWETGPEPKTAEKWTAIAQGGGVPKWPKNGWANGKSPNFSCPTICPALAFLNFFLAFVLATIPCFFFVVFFLSLPGILRVL